MKLPAHTLRAAQLLGLLAIFALIYYFLRLPTARLPLAFYDDAETLYHTLSLLHGGVPYLEDYNHHFMGYVSAFVLGAKIFGYSVDLIRQVAFINQTLMALGVYLCLEFLVSRRTALLGALLALSAREPWVLGFFQQYQINLFVVYCWLLCLRGLCGNRPLCFIGAFFLCGLLLTFDQRSFPLVLIPIFALLISTPAETRKKLPLLAAGVAAFLVPLAVALAYLWTQGALGNFIEQTLVFPTKYRVGGRSFGGLLRDAAVLHAHLLWQTPFLLCAGVLGFWVTFRNLRTFDGIQRQGRQLLLSSAIPLAVLPLFGGRDYDYYTITWLPFLAIFSVFSPAFFAKLPLFARRAYQILLVCPFLISLASAANALRDSETANYTGDGVLETVSFLRHEMKPEDRIFVWGYRMDVYDYLQKPAAYAMASTVFIHADQQVSDPAERAKHVQPEYEARFLKLWAESPPEFFVVFDREGTIHYPSRVSEAIFSALAVRYSKVFEIAKADFLGKKCTFSVYKLGQ